MENFKEMKGLLGKLFQGKLEWSEGQKVMVMIMEELFRLTRVIDQQNKLIELIGEKTGEPFIKVVEGLHSTILECFKVSHSVSLALVEKGTLTLKDVHVARQKIDDYGKEAGGIDWDKFDWEKIKTFH